MTHTLETTGIARVVARALRLNEDLTEAIGLGHDMGHPPFGHAGEAALDALLEAGFRHNEQSAQIARRLNLTHEVVDGILTHTGDSRAGDARGQDRPHRRPGRLHQPRHRRRDSLRHPRRGRPAARRDRDRSARPAPKRIDTLVHDLVETSARAGDIAQSDEIGARDALAARASCSSASTSGPVTRPEHERAHATIRPIYEHLAERGDDRGDRRVHRRHDRPVRAVVRCQLL